MVLTSGICQPPVHAIAAARIVEVAAADDASLSWAASVYPKLLAWHRYLACSRADPGSGLITLFHGWESGMDNSPRWDVPYSNVRPGPGPAGVHTAGHRTRGRCLRASLRRRI